MHESVKLKVPVCLMEPTVEREASGPWLEEQAQHTNGLGFDCRVPSFLFITNSEAKRMSKASQIFPFLL